jgi:hypothetical protein
MKATFDIWFLEAFEIPTYTWDDKEVPIPQYASQTASMKLLISSRLAMPQLAPMTHR